MNDPSEITAGASVDRQYQIADEELLALLFDAGRKQNIGSEAIVDVVQEALQSGRQVGDILRDAEILSRRQRESINELVRQQSRMEAGRSTAMGHRERTTRPQVALSAAERRRQDLESEFRTDRDELLPTGEDRYEPVEEVGRGGWGVVVRAADRQLHREVAVKKLGPAASRDADIGRRFLHEAQITAQLQHPGIVPVYERGVGLEDRQPFYAMKLLNGDTLQEKIRDYHDLPSGASKRQRFHQLLRSFIDICHAVSYAHARNIIHRDLKPANVVIGEFGETIVVDWGLATDLSAAESEAESVATLPAGTPLPKAAPTSARLNGLLSPVVTQEGSVVGTPAYMPPEQARGSKGEFSPASDTYSLGVMLYVILTGRLPFHGDDVETTLQQVMRGEYRHPQTVDKRTPAALASVCVKAMSLNPAERYQHAGELGDDVSRYLANERVTAHRDRLIDRFARWCRRHSTMATSLIAGAITLAVVSGVAAVLIRQAHTAEISARQQAEQAHREERRARQQAEQARADALDRLRKSRTAADTWLIGLSGALERFPGLTTVREDLIREALEHYTQLHASVKQDRQLILEAARCLLRMGDLHVLLGETDAAREAFTTAAEQLKKIDQTDQAVTETLNSETGLLLVELHGSTLSEAAAAQCDALCSAATLLLQTTDSGESRLAAGRAFLMAGRAAESRQQLEQASRRYQRADQVVAGINDSSLHKRIAHLRSVIRNDYSRVLTLLGRHREAAAELQRDVEATTRQIKEEHKRPDFLENRAIAQMKWANAQQRLGEDWAAEAAYRRAIDDLSASWQLMFGDHFYNENLAVAEANLGQLAVRLHRYDDAEQMLRSAIEQLTGLLEDGSADRDTISRLASCNVALGHVLVMTGDPAASEQIQRSLQIFEFLESESHLSASDHLARAAAATNLARVCREQQNPTAAQTAFQHASQIHQQSIDTLTAAADAPGSVRRLRIALAAAQWEFTPLVATESDNVRQQLEQLTVNESADEIRQPHSATQTLLRCLLDAGSTQGWQQAENLLQQTNVNNRRSPHLLQLQAISDLRQRRYDLAGDLIHQTLLARRHPLAVDYAIASCIAAEAGDQVKANEYRRQAETGLAQVPGDHRLRHWVGQAQQSAQSLSPVPAGPPQQAQSNTSE
ncbi:MAG: serine/threonine protein kinase [Planctomycetaceae bacterium]|nr:serine/threonine protein kinase [Planctomycetaceae bacterium]